MALMIFYFSPGAYADFNAENSRLDSFLSGDVLAVSNGYSKAVIFYRLVLISQNHSMC